MDKRALLEMLRESKVSLGLPLLGATSIIIFLGGTIWGAGLGRHSCSQLNMLSQAQQTLPPTNTDSPSAFIPAPIDSNRGQGFFEVMRKSVVPGGELRLSGWAFDQKDKAPVIRAWVIINNLAPLGLLRFRGNLARLDVVENFRGDESYKNSGWEGSFSTKGLRPGIYPFAVYAECQDGILFPLLSGGGISPTIMIAPQ